ncbi:MAG: preprotein translocase subunit SecE [Gemmatimonadaceae bacterium]|nr:preprotein translocase subunit SecE [Gemmatimonadaceae bacterium]
MSTAVETPRPSLPARVVTFYNDVMVEMRKVTWPDWPQVRQATLGIIAVVLFIGAVIGIIDLIAQAVLVTGLPRLFAR